MVPAQVVGFAVLVAGMSLYNELMRGCLRHSSAADETVIGSTRNARCTRPSSHLPISVSKKGFGVVSSGGKYYSCSTQLVDEDITHRVLRYQGSTFQACVNRLSQPVRERSHSKLHSKLQYLHKLK